MPEITDSIADARAKLMREVKTVAEVAALRQLLPTVRMIISTAAWEQIAALGADRDRQKEEAVFHGEPDA